MVQYSTVWDGGREGGSEGGREGGREGRRKSSKGRRKEESGLKEGGGREKHRMKVETKRKRRRNCHQMYSTTLTRIFILCDGGSKGRIVSW